MTALTKFAKRPKSICEVSAEVAEGRNYASAVKEFIDEIIAAAKPPINAYGFYVISDTHFTAEPLNLDDPIQRAHLAGLAENLAILSGQEPPEWTTKEAYFLKEPVYAGGKRSQSHLLADTPSAFRRRLLFCGPSLSKLFKLHPRPTISS